MSISSFLPSFNILNLTIIQVQECGNKWRLYVVHTLIMPVSYKTQAHVCNKFCMVTYFQGYKILRIIKIRIFCEYDCEDEQAVGL